MTRRLYVEKYRLVTCFFPKIENINVKICVCFCAFTRSLRFLSVIQKTISLAAVSIGRPNHYLFLCFGEEATDTLAPLAGGPPPGACASEIPRMRLGILLSLMTSSSTVRALMLL
jgi:hypothetical protein